MGAPTMATSIPSRSAGSSVYGSPANVARPAYSGLYPFARQRRCGSIMGRRCYRTASVARLTAGMASHRESRFPLGATVTVEELTADPHPVLRRLRRTEPVSWIPSLDAWLVTSRDLVLQAMRDAETFTVDDPRFSTAQVVGPSMLSTDGREHDRHREPFAAPFRLGPVRERFTEIIAEEVASRIAAMQRAGAADLRTEFTGPVAVRVVIEALGLGQTEPAVALGWYDAIVES